MRWPLLVLLTLIGVSVWLWRVGRRPLSKYLLIRRVYKHMDELLGARNAEGDWSATRRHYLSYLSEDWAQYLYPSPKLGGVRVLPRHRRRRRYIQIDWPHQPARKAYRLHDIRYTPITLHSTSEAPVNLDGYRERLERGHPTHGGGLAAALDMEWREGLFTCKRKGAHRWTFQAKRPTSTTPAKIDLRGDAGGL